MKSNMKKFMSCLLAAVLILALTPAAFAVNIPTSASGKCLVDEDTLTVDIVVSGNDAPVHVIGYVTPAGVVPNLNNVLAMGYADTTASLHSANIEIKVPDSVATGKYRVTVGVSGMASATAAAVIDNVDYIGYADRQRLADTFINAQSPEELVNAFNSLNIMFDIYGSNSSYYNALTPSDKVNFADYIYQRRENLISNGKLDFAAIGTLANEAFVVTYINSKYSAKSDADVKRATVGLKEVFSEYSGIINNTVNSGVSGAKMDIVKDSRYKAIGNGVIFFGVLRTQCEAAPGQGLTDISELTYDALNSTLTLERINECGYRTIGEIASQYNNILEVDEKQIAYVTKNSKIKDFFGKAMTDSKKDYTLPVYSLEDFRTAWSEAYKVAKKEYEEYLDSSSSGSSGGSGGGGGSAVISKPVTIDTSIVRDDPLDKKKSITDYYNDMAGYEWAASAVLALTDAGIVSGTGEMKYEPARTLKREEFMKLLVNTFKLADMKATCSFSDVTDANAWYYVYIASAEKAGITTGRGDGTFGIGEYVTREEMATMVYRAAVKSGAKLSTSANKGAVVYSDVTSLSAYAREAVLTLTNCGIMNGSDGKFSPQDGASRAQAAVVINNIKSYIQ